MRNVSHIRLNMSRKVCLLMYLLITRLSPEQRLVLKLLASSRHGV